MDIFGFSKGTFEKAVRANPIPVAESNSTRTGKWYYYDDVLPWIINYYHAKWTKAKTEAANKTATAKPSDDGQGENAAQAKARLTKEQADKEEILNKERRGELISVAEVQAAQEKINAFVSKRTAHVGSDVMRQLPNQPAESKKIIDTAMAELVESFASFDFE